jgi:hypothetical protein
MKPSVEEPSEESPNLQPDNTRGVDGFSYAFVLRLPNGLDMYRCERKDACSVLMFMHPQTGEVQFQNEHTHDAVGEKAMVLLNPKVCSHFLTVLRMKSQKLKRKCSLFSKKLA